MSEKTKITLLDKLKKDIIPGINLFEAILFSITTIIGIILFTVPIVNKGSSHISQDVITLLDIPLGILAATFLAKRNKLAPLLLAIDAILYGTANFMAGTIALGIVNAIITPVLYLVAYIWIWPKQEKENSNGEINTVKFSLKIGLFVIAGVFVISGIFGGVLPLIFPNSFNHDELNEQWLNEYKTWFDAFAATLMLCAVIASIFRFREAFYLYLVSNVMKIILFTTTISMGYSSDGLLLLLALAYFINAIFGILIWSDSKKII